MTPDQETTAAPLGQLIRDRRTHLGLGARTLAVRVGVDQSYISKIELGYVQMPKWDVLSKLADELGLDVMDLLRAAGNRVDDSEEDDHKPSTRRSTEPPKAPQIGVRIKELRRAQDLTQKDVAMKLGVSLQTVGNWEAGITPRTRYLHRLAELLRTTPDNLLGRSSESIRLDDPALVDLVNALQGFSSETREHLFAMFYQVIQVVRQVEAEAEARNQATFVNKAKQLTTERKPVLQSAQAKRHVYLRRS